MRESPWTVSVVFPNMFPNTSLPAGPVSTTGQIRGDITGNRSAHLSSEILTPGLKLSPPAACSSTGFCVKKIESDFSALCVFVFLLESCRCFKNSEKETACQQNLFVKHFSQTKTKCFMVTSRQIKNEAVAEVKHINGDL